MYGKSTIDHNIRLKHNLTVEQYIFIDCIHQFTIKKKFTIDWKDIKICIGFTEEEVISNFKSLKDSGLIEVKELKIKTTDVWACNFVEVDAVDEIIRYLNVRGGFDYKANSKSSAEHINARLREGYTLDDFKLVIDSKIEEWLDNSEMCQFLRPITLFAPKKYESYLQSAKLKSKKTITKLAV